MLILEEPFVKESPYAVFQSLQVSSEIDFFFLRSYKLNGIIWASSKIELIIYFCPSQYFMLLFNPTPRIAHRVNSLTEIILANPALGHLQPNPFSRTRIL